MVQPNGSPNARVGKRPTVAVVYDDVSKGYRCADWFALHGYQATMTSTVHPLEQNLKELRPDLIVVGFSSTPAPLHTTVPRLKTTCPQVPIIAIMEPSIVRSAGSAPRFATAFGADVFMCDSLDPPATLP
ncbi:MAG TPA: hypothetical protein PKV55_06080 [Nitrospira sp.]|nr:hypothetical protein [Nitrospira sp.]MBS0176560.1 hypothetical protein [Nitrospira sp.]MBX3337519.1 hypothetical protein [Nitrospira sp.]MCW5780937.1 hypothetical protein [Nitrospira sp.]HMZ55092.1 hypothetical protein [Nitrospira sp.]